MYPTCIAAPPFMLASKLSLELQPLPKKIMTSIGLPEPLV
jgi:hypothetical protein